MARDIVQQNPTLSAIQMKAIEELAAGATMTAAAKAAKPKYIARPLAGTL